MKPLRQKMIRAMELRNLAKGTQRNYLLSVIGATRYYQKSPDKLSKEMIEDYLLYLKNGKGNTPGSCSVAASGLRFFYNHVADKKIPIGYRFSKKRTKLPTVLTPEEVWKLIHTPSDIDDGLFSRTSSQ